MKDSRSLAIALDRRGLSSGQGRRAARASNALFACAGAVRARVKRQAIPRRGNADTAAAKAIEPDIAEV